MLDWPINWLNDDTIVSYLDCLRLAENKNFAILLLKNIDSFPSLLDIQSGYIDIWWIIHDGGLLFLLAFLLKRHSIWTKCILRLFTICSSNEDLNKRRTELEKYVYQLRIQAEVHVVPVDDQEISAFTKYQTMTIMNSKHFNPLQENHFHHYQTSKIFHLIFLISSVSLKITNKFIIHSRQYHVTNFCLIYLLKIRKFKRKSIQQFVSIN